MPSLHAARDVSSVLCSAASPCSVQRRGGGDGACAGRPETVAAAAEITKMGLNVSGRRCRPGGRYLRLAAGREPRGHLPNHRPRSRPGRAAPSRPSVPPPDAEGQINVVQPGCLQPAHFKPPVRARAVSVPGSAPRCDSGCGRNAKALPLASLFLLAESNFCFFKKIYMQTTARRHGYHCMLPQTAYFTSLDL